jgi:flagellar biosynthesis component FlhA
VAIVLSFPLFSRGYCFVFSSFFLWLLFCVFPFFPVAIVLFVLFFPLFSCGYCTKQKPQEKRGKDKTIATGKKGKKQNNSHRKKEEKTKQ